MEILLVNPPVNRICDYPVNYYPLGIGYLAAMTNRQGHNTRVYNAELDTKLPIVTANRSRLTNHELFINAIGNDDHPVWQEYRQVLKELKPQVVGFSCTAASIMPCLRMAREAKDIVGATTIFGGMHATLHPEETARKDAVDFITVGEAEESFPALISALDAGKFPEGIPGVGGYESGDFRFTAAGPLERDLDSLPFPDRDATVFFDRHKSFMQAMVASRGCPHLCTFCSGRYLHKGKVRYRSAENVVEEILWLKKRYGMERIHFYDDALILSKKRITQLCEEMIRKNTKVKWMGFTRVDSVMDNDLLKLLKASGCDSLGMGVESGSNRTLKLIKKGYTREQAITGVKMVKRAGIFAHINIIVGFPFEREEDLLDTLDLIKQCDAFTNINTFTPYPGSELYDECVERGLIQKEMDWLHISQHSLYNDFIDEISAERYAELLEELVTAADAIANKPPLARYVRRMGEIWFETDRNPFRFTGTLAWRAVKKVRQAALPAGTGMAD